MLIVSRSLGFANMEKELKRQKKNINGNLEHAKEAVVDFVLAVCWETCPLDTGNLRASAEIIEKTNTGERFITYPVHYAWKQHEDLTYFHPPPRRAKWLELAIKENQAEINKIIKSVVGLGPQASAIRARNRAAGRRAPATQFGLMADPRIFSKTTRENLQKGPAGRPKRLSKRVTKAGISKSSIKRKAQRTYGQSKNLRKGSWQSGGNIFKVEGTYVKITNIQSGTTRRVHIGEWNK